MTITDLVGQCKKSIDALCKSYWERRSFFSVLGMSRSENRNSRFIIWLLDPQSEHGLAMGPIKEFVRLLAKMKSDYPINAKALLPFDLKETDSFCERISGVTISGEVPATSNASESYGRIDILIEVDVDGQTWPIVVENKIDSTEHIVRSANKMQTIAYCDWAKAKYGDQVRYKKPTFVYLTADGCKDLKNGNGVAECASDLYLRINYQGFVDLVVDPMCKECKNNNSKGVLESYLRCVGLEGVIVDDSEKMKRRNRMAISQDERTLLRVFWEENQDILLSVLGAVSEDPELPKEDQEQLSASLSKIKKNSKRYKFNGEVYARPRVVWAVVKQYIEDHPKADFNQLTEDFPKELEGPNTGVVRCMTDNFNQVYFYVNDKDLLALKDGTRVAVCRVWRSENFASFQKRAKELNYSIEEDV